MNKYWQLDKLQMSSKEVENFIKFILNKGSKTVIDLHKHSCAERKYPRLHVGGEYFVDTAPIIEYPKYEKCKITGIRSGIVFYIIEGEIIEKHFEEFSLMHYFCRTQNT